MIKKNIIEERDSSLSVKIYLPILDEKLPIRDRFQRLLDVVQETKNGMEKDELCYLFRDKLFKLVDNFFVEFETVWHEDKEGNLTTELLKVLKCLILRTPKLVPSEINIISK